MPIGRKLFEYLKRKKGNTRHWKRALQPRKRALIIPQGHHGQVGKGHPFLAVSNPIFLRALRPITRAPTAMAFEPGGGGVNFSVKMGLKVTYMHLSFQKTLRGSFFFFLLVNLFGNFLEPGLFVVVVARRTIFGG